MVKNTGKPSEHLFDAAFALLGKRAFVYKFTDAAAATGRNGRVTIIDSQPSDRIVTVGGHTHYAEIKSTIEEKRFPFKLLRKSQSGYARMIVAAGGDYLVYIHSLAHDQWYCVPYGVLRLAKDAGEASMTWEQLEKHKWRLPTL